LLSRQVSKLLKVIVTLNGVRASDTTDLTNTRQLLRQLAVVKLQTHCWTAKQLPENT